MVFRFLLSTFCFCGLLAFTFHASRITFHASRFTFHVSRFTLHASRFTLQLSVSSPSPISAQHPRWAAHLFHRRHAGAGGGRTATLLYPQSPFGVSGRTLGDLPHFR